MRLAGVVAVSTRKSRGWAWGRRAMCVLACVVVHRAVVVDVPRLVPDCLAADSVLWSVCTPSPYGAPISRDYSARVEYRYIYIAATSDYTPVRAKAADE